MAVAGTDEGATPHLPTSLRGRNPELTQLFGLVDGVQERGGALVVRGEAGIGKSALLAQAAARALERDVTVVEATGTESEEQLAFAGLHHLLRRFLDYIDGLPAPQRRALETAFGVVEGDAPDLFLIGLAALGLVAEGAEQAPLLLVVEDAQWLDQPSSEVLAFLGRRLEMEPVLLLLSVRDGMPSELDDAGLPELHLTGLDDDTARALVHEATPDVSEHLMPQILAESAGNPLALIELSVAAANAQVDPGRSTSETLPLTARLERAFAVRLPELDERTRTLLLLAALDDIELAQLDQAAALLEGGAISSDAWAPAVKAGLGRVEAGGFQFRHPLIRSAVRQAATPDELRRAHAALAEILGDDPDRAVWHNAAAASEPDEAVAAALVATAERARLRGGADVAVVALERAAGLTPDPELRGRRLQRAGEIAWDLGRAAASRRLFQEAQPLVVEPHARVRLRSYLDVLDPHRWSGAAAVRDFARVAEQLSQAGEPERALESLETVIIRLFFSDITDETRREVAAMVKRIAVSPDDPLRVSVLAHIDPVREAAWVVEQLSRMSPSQISAPERLQSLGSAASAVWADDLARHFLSAAIDGSRAEGRLGILAETLVLEAWSAIRQGDVRAAIMRAAEGVRLAEETGQARYAAVGRLAHAIAAAERGVDDEAEQLIGEAEAVILPTAVTPLLGVVEFARGRQALAAERFAPAYEHLIRIFTPDNAAYQPFVRGWALADLAEAAVRSAGSISHVRGLLEEWEQIAAESGSLQLQAQLDYADAVLADNSSAEERFERAITAAPAKMPLYAARAQLAYGAWLRRMRRVSESRAPLRQAAHTFDALGLLQLAERARRELRASGETVGRRGPESWAELTPQELQIAQFAAQGLSNREIGERLYLSHRTIGSHLYRLYPKLGVTSRAQLGAALEFAPAP